MFIKEFTMLSCDDSISSNIPLVNSGMEICSACLLNSSLINFASCSGIGFLKLAGVHLKYAPHFPFFFMKESFCMRLSTETFLIAIGFILTLNGYIILFWAISSGHVRF